jgi:hypothetical protein
MLISIKVWFDGYANVEVNQVRDSDVSDMERGDRQGKVDSTGKDRVFRD